MQQIEIIGQTGECIYSNASIQAIVDNATTVANQHGETFTGRPSTELLITAQHIIKLRTEYNLPAKDSQRFIHQAVEKERALDIYHPAKTWFLLHREAENPLIGNITPRLLPLHEREALETQIPGGDYLGYLCDMFACYLRVAAQHDLSLDISLSNFAVDQGGNLYYLDDDTYNWDKFTTFSHFIGTLIRSQVDIDEQAVTRLGACIKASLIEHFKDRLWLQVVVEEIRGIFLPESRKPVIQALINALYAKAVSVTTHQSDMSNTEKSSVIALLADVHANAPALETALDYLAKRGISDALVLGDIVGYGPHPKQCISLLQSQPGFSVIKGNHDHAASSQNYCMGFSAMGKWVVEWTANCLSDEERLWLTDLPLYIQGDEWIAVHGAPTDKTFFNAYVYEMTYEENLLNLEKRQMKYAFHGHTHLQKTYYRNRYTEGNTNEAKQQLGEYQQALVCPGSVGQPRGNIPGCELALVDTKSWELEYLHLDYDMTPTLNDMRQADFPSTLIERLSHGK